MYIQDRPQRAVKQPAQYLPGRMARMMTLAAVLLPAACSDGKNVAPPAPAWTIGGTVTGLAGSGLRLRNNGAGSLPVLADGPFAFATTLADGAAYDVDVLAQPGSPAQLCTVSNGAGTVAAANVTDIVITCIPKPNDAPVAVNDPLVAIAVTGVPVDIPTATLLANDTDVDIGLGISQTLSVTAVSSLIGGTVSLVGSTVTFTSAPVFTGTASFEYTVSDGAGGTDIGIVTVKVDPPDITAPTVSNMTTTPPGVVTTTPAPPGPDVITVAEVPVTAAVVVTFSEAMNATTLLTDDAVSDPHAFALTGPAAAVVPGVVTATANTNNSFTFTPTSPLATNTDYTVTITTAATDTSGNPLAAAYDWPFTTSHWGKADELTTATDNQDGASSPQIAVDAGGNALAVWAQSDGIRYNIWARHYTAGATNAWDAIPVLIEADDTGSADAPDVAFDADGNALVVWQQWDGQRISIWANRYTAGAGWGGAALIETDDTGNALSPRIAFDAAGNALVVWQQHDGTRYNIWANRYTAGAPMPWGPAEPIETDDAGDAYYPRIAFDAAGNALAVWQQHDGTRYNIWANRYATGVWGVAELIETGDGPVAAPLSAHVPKLAVEFDGDATVVWFQSDGTRTNIWANRYTASVGWGVAELIENDNTGDATYPEVAVNASGNATVVWFQSDGARTNIWANDYSTGWGSPTLVETDDTGNAYAPQVVVAANGDAVAVWLQSDGTRYNVRTSRHVAGAPDWGATELIEFAAGTAAIPDIAINSADHVFAVWRQFDGTRDNIWANDRDP